jgi:hypothetical protein
MRAVFALLLLLVAVPASAQPAEPEWRLAREEQIFVRVGRFEPDLLRLEAGRPTRLVFRNGSRTRLSIAAAGFLAASRVHPRDAQGIQGGGFTLGPGEVKTITLVPYPGNYSIGSGSWFRSLLGMRARIIVESPQRTSGQPVTP